MSLFILHASRNLAVGVHGLAFLLLLSMVGCVHEPMVDSGGLGGDPAGDPNPPTSTGCLSDGSVCFESTILPIFQSSCARSGCHNATSRKEGYVLDSYSNIVRKGIVAGSANKSKLYTVLFASGEDRMPPDGPLSQAQKDSIAAWINEGARNTMNCNCNCDAQQFTYAAVIQPLLNNQCVGCHKPGSLGGGVDLSTYAAVKLQAGNGNLLGTIQHQVGYAAMPQGGSMLSDCEISQVANWIDAGVPNN